MSDVQKRQRKMGAFRAERKRKFDEAAVETPQKVSKRRKKGGGEHVSRRSDEKDGERGEPRQKKTRKSGDARGLRETTVVASLVRENDIEDDEDGNEGSMVVDEIKDGSESEKEDVNGDRDEDEVEGDTQSSVVDASVSNNEDVEKKIITHRFILFVGGLPYSATKEQIAKHFESAGTPSSVRLITDKITKKPKGYAFVEFESAVSMKRALRFHHTTFKGRKIRIELTAGGGGSKSGTRRQRIVEKNQKLDRERQKYHETHVTLAQRQAGNNVHQKPKGSLADHAANNKRKSKAAESITVKRPRRVQGTNAIKIQNKRTFMIKDE